MTSTPDLSGYRAIHVALRSGARRMADAAVTFDPADRRRAKAFARYWKGYAGEVVIHHTIEDDVFFPALVEKVPTAAGYTQRTDADHHHLDDLMGRLDAAFTQLTGGGAAVDVAPLLRELADHMEEHLAFEDADLLPLFERHFSAEEYEEMDARALKAIGLGTQAAFTIPFVAAALPADVRDEVFAIVPTAFRVIYRLTRGRHARLARRALGAAADQQEVTA
jgi:hemerythrin-like domain-containing protein